MPFVLPELVIESVIRDGFTNARKNSEAVISDVFGNLTRAFAEKKYGEREIAKIQKLVEEKEVSVVHAFSMVQANLPCISIQLLGDNEDESKASIGDHAGFYDVPMTDPDELAALVIVESFQPTAYNTNTGAVSVPDEVDLSLVYANLVFVDSVGVEHTILGGIDNTPGRKSFMVAKSVEVSLAPGAEIKSSINFKRYETRSNVERVQILIGIHTGDPLTTKYLYTLVKYFILSRKKDVIRRDFQLASYNGSDFHRNMEYKGDSIYSRNITITGMLQHDWRSDLVDLVDQVIIKVKVPADKYGNEALDREDQTVQVNKD